MFDEVERGLFAIDMHEMGYAFSPTIAIQESAALCTTVLDMPQGVAGVVMCIHTFRDYTDFHPHLHALVAEEAGEVVVEYDHYYSDPIPACHGEAS